MLRSMTGFGRAGALDSGREVVVELKSVNHRYLDISMRLPRSLGFLEECIRSVLNSSLARGHIDVYVSYKNNRVDSRSVEVDEALISAYIDAISTARQLTPGIEDDVTLSRILTLPDVLEITEAQDDREAVVELCKEATQLASADLIAMRENEGRTLRGDLRARLDTILNMTTELNAIAPEVITAYREKLRERISELLDGAAEVDESRLANEVAYFADRANIDEELVRLKSHIDQFGVVLEGCEPSGRKLDFIVQEMNRELNTIGSKAADLSIINTVIKAKAEIEKIREQVQNIE